MTFADELRLLAARLDAPGPVPELYLQTVFGKRALIDKSTGQVAGYLVDPPGLAAEPLPKPEPALTPAEIRGLLDATFGCDDVLRQCSGEWGPAEKWTASGIVNPVHVVQPRREMLPAGDEFPADWTLQTR